MATTKLTPMLRQYLDVKNQHPDALVFYRMGDFYELFFEDAETAAPVMDIALTSRNKKDANPVPMCGVPYRAVQGYLAKLIGAGFKVAICDQVEDPAEAKGLVRREVTRVVTPGMIVDDDLLDGRAHNFIVAVAGHNTSIGLAAVDISTGVFRVTQSDFADEIIDEIRRIAPKEIILPETDSLNRHMAGFPQAFSETALTRLSSGAFNLTDAQDRLTRHFKTVTLEGFGCDDWPAAIRAAGAALRYIQDTQMQEINHLAGMESYQFGSFLVVDDLSCRNLELMANLRNGSRRNTLLEIIDTSVTAMGSRMMAHWLRYPLREPARIARRHEGVEQALADMGTTTDIRQQLKSVADLERLGAKINMARANARDLAALSVSLHQLPQIADALSAFSNPSLALKQELPSVLKLADRIASAIRDDAPISIHDGGMIRDGYHEELDRLIAIGREGKGYLAHLEAEEKSATGIGSLKVRFNKVFGYYIEVPKSQSDAVPVHYVRKQTLVNAERYITDDLKKFETEVLTAEDRQSRLEFELFEELRLMAAALQVQIEGAARDIARIDCLLALAQVADANQYCRPTMTDSGAIEIVNGRHPVVEKLMVSERFVPNTIRLDMTDQQVLIITGPNMAGKSTILRQVALTTILAHMGSFVPAESASIGLADRIFTRVGALDNLSQGQSTFLVEMQETANILNHATADSLVIMDEIGRGTSTFDGLSIAWAVAEYLHNLKSKGVKTLFATHYHELTQLGETHHRVRNFHIAVKEWNDDIIFLRKLVDGGTNRSYGIQVARLAGVPATVVARAKSVLMDIESRAAETPAHSEDGELHDSDGDDQPAQLPLFETAHHALVEGIRKLDLGTMTPLEAMNYLDSLQHKLLRQSNA